MEVDPLAFEPGVMEYLRQNTIMFRVLLILTALMYVDRLWVLSKGILKSGLMGCVLVVLLCGSARGQLITDTFTAKMGGEDVVLLPANKAILAQHSVGGSTFGWVALHGAIFPTGSIYRGGPQTHDMSYFCEWKLDLPPGRYRIYGQWEYHGGTTPPGAFAVSKSPIVNNQYRSPQIIFTSTATEMAIGYQGNDATVEIRKNGGTLVNGAVPVKDFGEVTIWGTAAYVAVRDHPAALSNAACVSGFFVAKKVGDVPAWHKYIGGDVDTTGYFDSLTASDGVSAVILPVEMLNNRGPAASNPANPDLEQFYDGFSVPNFGLPTTQTGVVARYVQLTFTDARYGASGHPWRDDAGTPTLGWVIALGRNGGLTARTVKSVQNQGRAVTSYTWINHTPGSAGPPPVTGQWYHEAQIRDSTRWVKYLPNGLPEAESWEMSAGSFLSRFPYSEPDFYFSPTYKSGLSVGSGTNGVSAPTAAATPGLKSPTTSVPGATGGDQPGFDPIITPPAGYAATSAAGLVIADHMRYPLHINHLRMIVQLCRTNPPIGEAERRFVDLLEAWIAACDGTYTFAEYRQQVARGAQDALTLEEGETVSDAIDQATIRPTVPTAPGGGTLPDRGNPFAGSFPSGQAGAAFELDLNPAFHTWGFATNPALVIRVNTDPQEMAAMAGGPGAWESGFQLLDDARIWIRGLLLLCLNVWFYWGQVSRIWSET